MIRAVLFLALVAFAAGTTPEEREKINAINAAKLPWKAAPNHITSMDMEARKRLLGAWKDPQLSSRPRYTPPVINADIPDSFDSRQEWSNCATIASIKDQGNCGSCWAVSSAAAMSDRLCIATGGKTSVDLSAEDLVDCCTSCGDGCGGGYPNEAWNFFVSNGIVTGGEKSNQGCRPYSSLGDTQCDRCTNPNYKTPFDQDKHYGKTSFYLDKDVRAIQQEIMTNGPVVAAFAVYSDFMSYSSGVYVQTSQSLMGYHAVRVLGWGTEGGVDYWLVANSWNTYWGENGLFKIRRGTNECGFEEQMVAGQALK